MRVLFLATYFPRPSNMRMGTWSLDHAVALRDAGMDVAVVSLTPAIPRIASKFVPSASTYVDCPATAELSGINVQYPGWLCYPIKQLWPTIGRAPQTFLSIGWQTTRKKVISLVDEFQPDVVLANHSLVNGYVASKIRQERNVPFITVDHEVGDFFACRENSGWMKVMKQVAGDASLGVTVSRAMQTIAEETIPDADFETVYNGASFEACDDSLLDRHESKTDLVIFCCGNLYGRKDIPLLIQAFDGIASQFPQARLRIAGDGPDRVAIQTLVDGLLSRQQIELIGSIEHHEVQSEMQSADIFALVGWAEPFGVVFLEAMANGCPVVVAEDAGVAEILEDGKTAVFTKPRDLHSVIDALARLCESAIERALIARAGHAFYRDQCHWRHRALEYRDVLERVANSHEVPELAI